MYDKMSHLDRVNSELLEHGYIYDEPKWKNTLKSTVNDGNVCCLSKSLVEKGIYISDIYTQDDKDQKSMALITRLFSAKSVKRTGNFSNIPMPQDNSQLWIRKQENIYEFIIL